MAVSSNLDISSVFASEARALLFNWVEEQVGQGLSDAEIIENYRKDDPLCDEDDVRFVEWALYYFKMIEQRQQTASENDGNQEDWDVDVDDNEEDNEEEDEDGDDDDDDDDDTEKEKKKSDDFDALLDEFIAKQLAEFESTSDDDDSEMKLADLEDDELDEEAVKRFEEESVDYVQVVVNGNSVCKNEDYNNSSRTLLLLRNDHFIHLRFTYSAKINIKVTLHNPRCHTILRQDVYSMQAKKTNGCVTLTFNADDLIPKRVTASDSLQISICRLDSNKEIYTSRFGLLCADTIFDTLKIDRMAFFPSAKTTSPTHCNTATSYIGFALHEAQQINVHCVMSPRTEVQLDKYEMYYQLYDPTGKLIERNSAEVVGDYNSSISTVCTSFRPEEWQEGRYRVELTAFGRSLMISTLNLGANSLEGEVDVPQVISILKANDLSDQTDKALDQLDRLIGLKRVKEKIHSLSRLSSLAQLRKEMGLPVKAASLHARFVGNPGTGKTTVAKILGQVYKELGLLSRGHVVRVERKNLVGRYYDSELRATEQAIESAQGGILFIDEAYTLCVPDDPRDPGRHILEALLTALSDENRRDWMLILAGYPDSIEQMIRSNEGLASRVEETFVFDDYDVEELMQIADLYCKTNKYKMSAEVSRHLHSVVTRDYGSRDANFGNARYITNLMEQVVIANMSHRVSRIEKPTKEQLQTIEVSDIPSLRQEENDSKGMARLNKMVGLTNLKRSLSEHLNMVRVANMRMKHGLHTTMPPLHMIFTGNPGTGKTTVADFLGEIYASMGLLSKGDVIRVEKRDLVGEHVGDTERKMRSILNRAKGNILFLDEAYQLYSKDGQSDYGKNVIDSLLTTLANDNVDMIVILAGYPQDMERLMAMNAGLPSRFPYTFHFEDYSVEELHKIALQRAAKDNYTFSKKAEQLLKSLIKREVLRKRRAFGNARFVTRLLSAEILPRMATRLSKSATEPSTRQLKTIVAEDIPITEAEAERIERGGFDNDAIDAALQKLDSLVGQNKVKQAIHNFVDIARYLQSNGEAFVGKGLLKWNFVGNTGTGKSTVAEILAEILKAMNLLDKGNVVEVRGEQIFNVSEYQCDQVLRQAMESSRHGLLFIDGDAPEFRNMFEYRLTSEQLRIKLTSLVAETGGQGALVIAECNSPRQTIANTLTINGIYDFDHTFFFDDYTSEELFEILSKRLGKHKVTFAPEAEAKMRQYIGHLCANRNLSFANARTMKHLARTIYEQVILRASKDKTSPRNVVTLADVEGYHWQQPRKIGY